MRTTANTRVTAYVRVTTDGQAAEDRMGKPVQEKAIRAYARQHGLRIVSWHYDDGVSGSNGLDTQEGLPLALAEVRDGTVKGIIVYRLDRLARDLIIQETLLAEIKRMGGTPFTTSGAEADFLDDDPNDPSRKLIRQVLGSVNEYERSMIALRLRSGRKLKAERGGFAYGSPGFGYRAENKQLVPDDREQQAVRRIREMHDAGTSLRQIIIALEAEGITPKRGGTWHPTTVRRVLARLEA